MSSRRDRENRERERANEILGRAAASGRRPRVDSRSAVGQDAMRRWAEEDQARDYGKHAAHTNEMVEEDNGVWWRKLLR